MCNIHIYLENNVCKKLMYVEVLSSVKVMKLIICILLFHSSICPSCSPIGIHIPFLY
jgi:hypothetical protein